MYENADLDAAVKAGVLPSDAAERFRAFSAQRSGEPAATAENFRMTTGFADMFVAAGVVLVLFSIHVATIDLGPGRGMFFIAAAWPLAEYFVRRRKMLLPGFVLFGFYALGVAFALFALSLQLPGPGQFDTNMRAHGLAETLTPLRGLATSAGVVGACFLFWRRFDLPIAYAVMILIASNLLLYPVRMALPDQAADLEYPVMMLCGIATFALAMWWDMSDVHRETKRSDIAFWLHMIAGFMIANLGLSMLIGLDQGLGPDHFRMTMMSMTAAQATGILAFYALFILISLIVDRRSLMLSGIVFLFSAAATLSGASQGRWPVIFGAIVSGLLILTAAIWWVPLRRALLACLPDAVRAQLPRAEIVQPGRRPVA